MTTYSHAQDAVRAHHQITETGAGLLDAWASLVEECAEGYDWHVTEYWNELRVRDRIESVLSAVSLQGFSEHGEFSARVHAIDARFRRIAAPDRSFERPGGWWHRAVPRTAGEAFFESCRSYGVQWGAGMSIAEARALAWELLTVGAAHREYRLAIDDSQTREEIFGWVFFYNSAEFMATRDLRWALGGNAPLIVDRVSRAVVVTGTARPVDVYLAHYSQHGTLDGFR